MIQHVESCVSRSSKYPISAAEFEVTVRIGHDVHDANEAINFLWLPWAIVAGQRLLERHERMPLGPDHLTRVRRARSHLIGLAGEDAMLHDERTFALAELLYALGSVP